MLCNTCKNKSICKHYEYMNNILIDITIQVTNCELYSNNNSPTHIPNQKPLYRQPLPSSLEEDEDEIDEEEDEKVFIDINSLENNEPRSASIIDIFMKGDKKND